MADAVETQPKLPVRATWRTFLWLLLPLALLFIAIAWIAASDPLRGFGNGAPAVEALTYERTILNESGIQILVRAGGSDALSIAQVQVDDAYWNFIQDPPGPIDRGSTAWLRLAYPWVLGEAHAVRLVTNTGMTFDHAIEVAVPTPTRDNISLTAQAVLGAFVGILPVAVGLGGLDTSDE